MEPHCGKSAIQLLILLHLYSEFDFLIWNFWGQVLHQLKSIDALTAESQTNTRNMLYFSAVFMS